MRWCKQGIVGYEGDIRRRVWRPLLLLFILLLVTPAFSACSLPSEIPLAPEIPTEFPDLFGLPRELEQAAEIWRGLGLPDLSSIPNLPSIDILPAGDPGSLVFRGPVERAIQPGERIAGTDIEFSSVDAEGATFQIAGLRSVRAIGDSLDYDGEWLGGDVGTYHLRLRIYQIGESTVRVAGVHQLEVRNVNPVQGEVSGDVDVLRFPYTVQAATGETFEGLTYGFGGQEERGARLTGLPEGDYPFRKLGDSIRWAGTLRPGISVVYDLRVLYYSESQATLGGIASVSIPGL